MAKTIEQALKRVWLKMLKAYAKGKLKKARRLEAKIIQLELELNNDQGEYTYAKQSQK